MNLTKTAAIYARFSTDKQEARSLDDQLRRCRKFAADRGLEVVAEYQDAAISGSTLDRVNLQKLLKDAKRGDFDVVLVDDLSRLSRDLGDIWQLVFNTLPAYQVSVIDCTTTMASNSRGARMTFGAMGLIADGFLQMIREETHRGLEGRALAGFATGGKTFGFKTVPEPNPPNPEKVRKLRVIDQDEASVVPRPKPRGRPHPQRVPRAADHPGRSLDRDPGRHRSQEASAEEQPTRPGHQGRQPAGGPGPLRSQGGR